MAVAVIHEAEVEKGMEVEVGIGVAGTIRAVMIDEGRSVFVIGRAAGGVEAGEGARRPVGVEHVKS